MKKILFRKLYLEVTRKCQFNCDHCMRGDAQNVDMQPYMVDAFLDQTAGIFIASFTGGEPLLNIKIMRYFLDEVKKREIPLGGIDYITNGMEPGEDVKSFILDALEYIRHCRRKYWTLFDSDLYDAIGHPSIKVGISYDQYHQAYFTTKTGKNYEEYVNNVKSKYEHIFNESKGHYDDCIVHFHTVPYIVKVGHAESNQSAVDQSNKINLNAKTVLSIFTQDDSVIHSVPFDLREIMRHCDSFVASSLTMLASGKIIYDCDTRNYNEESENATIICNIENGMYPDIFDSIKCYNRGRIPRYVSKNTPLSIDAKMYRAYRAYRKADKPDSTPTYVNKSYKLIFPDTAKEFEKHTAYFNSLYLKYLTERVLSYTGYEEIKKDFPYSNSYFLDDVLGKVQNAGNLEKKASEIAQWIYKNKDLLKYTTDDEARKLIIQDYGYDALNDVDIKK